jgi:hypothetical protein
MAPGQAGELTGKTYVNSLVPTPDVSFTCDRFFPRVREALRDGLIERFWYYPPGTPCQEP